MVYQMVINTSGMTSEKKKDVFFYQEAWRRFCNGLERNFSTWKAGAFERKAGLSEIIQMLKDHLLPFVETKEHEFQQENAPIHV